jgi:hypothetical protein
VTWATKEALPVSSQKREHIGYLGMGAEKFYSRTSREFKMHSDDEGTSSRDHSDCEPADPDSHLAWSLGKGGKTIGGHEIRFVQNRSELYSVRSFLLSEYTKRLSRI